MYDAKKASSSKMPQATHGLRIAKMRLEKWLRETPPISFIPRERRESPAELNSATPASTMYFLKVTRIELRLYRLCLGRFHRRRFFFAVFLDPLMTLRPQFQEGARFLVQPLALGVVEHGFAKNAIGGLRTEIVFVVEM